MNVIDVSQIEDARADEVAAACAFVRVAGKRFLDMGQPAMARVFTVLEKDIVDYAESRLAERAAGYVAAARAEGEGSDA